jgi:CelD/BcsL family acetyltransferase involved in cellulose biosynthesis
MFVKVAAVQQRHFIAGRRVRMTMVAATGDHPAMTTTAAVARIEMATEIGAAEASWRALQTNATLFTPFQRFDFLAAWQRHVGARENVTPCIVSAFDAAGRPLALLPLGVQSENGVRVARFLGDKHATFNMPLLARDALAAPGLMDQVLAGLRRHADRPDLLALLRQPARWEGIANPMATLPCQPAVNPCPLLLLPPGAAPNDLVSNSFRRRLKGKERKLQASAGYRYTIARSDDEIHRILDAFFVIKPLRMAAQKLPNVFAEPGVRDFVYDACLSLQPGGGRTIEIHALECDEEVIAIFAGVADGRRFSMMFNTYTVSPQSKYSPGLILLRNIIDHYAGQGYDAIDLGIGSDDYKLLFCKDDEPLFDSFLPLTGRGTLAAFGLSSLNHAKRVVKRNPALAQMAHLLRGAFQR